MTLRKLINTLSRRPSRAAVEEAAELLDPQHQGEQWPDPIAWDGRLIKDQARDLIPLLENLL